MHNSCSLLVDNISHEHLHALDTTIALVSRAPLSKLTPFKDRMGWTVPWYSSFGSGFNYDFHVTNDESVAPVEYNYKDKATLIEKGTPWYSSGEWQGLSVFLRDGDDVYHTYSAYDAASTTGQHLHLPRPDPAWPAGPRHPVQPPRRLRVITDESRPLPTVPRARCEPAAI